MFCTCKTASDLIFLAAFRCRKWKYSRGVGVASDFADEQSRLVYAQKIYFSYGPRNTRTVVCGASGPKSLD